MGWSGEAAQGRWHLVRAVLAVPVLFLPGAGGVAMKRRSWALCFRCDHAAAKHRAGGCSVCDCWGFRGIAEDYTGAKLSRVVKLGAIVVCEVCGKRGKLAGGFLKHYPGVTVYHRASVSPTLGCTVWDTDGYCSIRFAGPVYPRKVCELREGR